MARVIVCQGVMAPAWHHTLGHRLWDWLLNHRDYAERGP